MRTSGYGALTGHGRSRLHHHSLILSITSLPAANQRRKDSYVRVGMFQAPSAADLDARETSPRCADMAAGHT